MSRERRWLLPAGRERRERRGCRVTLAERGPLVPMASTLARNRPRDSSSLATMAIPLTGEDSGVHLRGSRTLAHTLGSVEAARQEALERTVAAPVAFSAPQRSSREPTASLHGESRRARIL